jgi:hypothetical protein
MWLRDRDRGATRRWGHAGVQLFRVRDSRETFEGVRYADTFHWQRSRARAKCARSARTFSLTLVVGLARADSRQGQASLRSVASQPLTGASTHVQSDGRSEPPVPKEGTTSERSRDGRAVGRRRRSRCRRGAWRSCVRRLRCARLLRRVRTRPSESVRRAADESKLPMCANAGEPSTAGTRSAASPAPALLKRLAPRARPGGGARPGSGRDGRRDHFGSDPPPFLQRVSVTD